MKFFSSLLILAAIAGTSNALESTCCDALEGNGCAEPFPMQKYTWTTNGIGMVTCCKSLGNEVDLVGNNPSCAGSETPPPAPTPTVNDNTPTPTDIDNTSSVVTFGGSSPGMANVAASCDALKSQFQDCSCSVQCQDGETKCLEADSAGCSDAAKTFCVGQGSSVYLSCGHTETYSETSSESHSSTTTTTTTGSTEYVCNVYNGEYCTLSSNGGLCSPIGQGLPSGNIFMPTLSGFSSRKVPVPFPCIGINDSELVSGGGSCQMSCPDTCKVTPDVTNPCGSTGGTPSTTTTTTTGSMPSPTPSAGFTLSTSVAIGASVAFLAMIFV